MHWVQWRRSQLFSLAPKSLCWTWRWRCHIWFQVSFTVTVTVFSWFTIYLYFCQVFHWWQYILKLFARFTLVSRPVVSTYSEFCTIYTSVNIFCTIYTMVPVLIYLYTWHFHISHWSTSSACKAPTNKAWNVQCLFKLQQSLKCWMLILLKYINLQIYIL